MFARVASFEGGDTDRLRQAAEPPSEPQSVPAGMIGGLGLADRTQNRRLFISLFDSREAIEAAAAAFEQMGDEIPEEVRGRRTAVEVYEVAVDEGGWDGAGAARLSLLEGPAEKLDEATRYAQENVLPRARQLPGWKGVLSLIDRESGRGSLITFWESAEAMDSSEAQGDQLRRQSAEASGGTIRAVERYDVVFSRRT